MCHFLEEIRSVYYFKDQVKVRPAVIQYKGVNGVFETQEPRGAFRRNGAVLHHKDHRWLDQAS